MKYRILGPVELERGALAGARQRHLLALLLAHAGEVVATDRIAEELWGDDQPSDPAGAVRTQVSRLRRAGADVATRAGGYVVEPEPDELDAQRFRRLVDEAAGAPPAAARPRLEEALALWRGPAFGDLAERDFAKALATGLEELRFDAEERRAELLLDTGAVEEAIRTAEALVAAAPVRERPRALLMRALYAAGRQVDALDAYQAYRRFLAEELGLEPSPDLRALERDLLDHRPPGGAARRVAVPVTSFVGRDEAVATVGALLDRARLVTLTGPGGVGKTRLALHVAAERGPRHRDGAVCCDLAAVSDEAGVLRTLAAALAVVAQPGRPLSAAIVDGVRARDVLLVLDNCEHVLEPVAALLEQILPRSDDARVVATSRERLAVDGEHVYPLAPLALGGAAAPAVQLFVDRARAAAPHVALDLDAVAQLCRRLDGLPLAIELAAALTGALSIDEIVEGLDARFQLLTGGRRANARHRSLEAAIDWSYAALSPAEQELFCCCSLFAGRFTAADARALAAPELAADAVAPLLARLVERSMLVRDAAGTFALLETLREYGRRRLAQRARLDTGRDRHARHFVALATRDPAAVDERIDELRAAHRWLLAHGDVAGALELAVAAYRAAVVRMRAEVHEWAQRALAAAADDDSPAAFADACASAAVGAWQSGDLDAADRLARRGLARSYLCEEVLGDVCLFRGDLDGAYDHATRAAERAAAAGDGATEVRSLVNRALARSYAGRHAEAIALAEEVVARADVVGGPAERALALYTDGECRLDVDPQGALARLDRARELARDAGAAFVVGIATVSAASLRSRQGDDTGAIALYSELVDHWWRERVWTQQWTTLRTLVEVLCRVGEHEAAGVLLGAVEHAASTPPFGADADRLARLHEELRAVLGDEPLTAAVARGGALGGEGAVDFARRTLRRLHARAAGGGG